MTSFAGLGKMTYNLIAPFPSKAHFSAGEEAIFGEIALSYSPNEEELFVNFSAMLTTADFSSIEKSSLVSCGEEFALYKNIFDRKYLPAGAQTLAPFQGKIKYFILPYGNAICTKINRKELLVNLSDPLETTPKKLLKMLKISKHSKVIKGTVLAERILHDNMTWLRSVSPIDGVVEDIDLSSGNILIRRFEFDKTVKIPLPGKVTGVTETSFCSSMTVQSSGYFIKSSFSFGKPHLGNLVLIPNDPDERNEFYKTGCLAEKIAVFDEALSPESLDEALNYGIKALVCPSMEDETKKMLKKKPPPITVAVVFYKGVNRFPESMMTFFEKHESKPAVVSRPENFEELIFHIPSPDAVSGIQPLIYPEISQEVLICAGQYANKTGKVVHSETHRVPPRSDIPTVGIKVRGTNEIIFEQLNDLW
ncbi:hypothetical protein JXL83_04200 [candidate division WOR-3 bacterium]|nr:hypothetical protein [candidate division WOR-3 bacterium]